MVLGTVVRWAAKKLGKPKMKPIELTAPPEQTLSISRAIFDVVKEHGPLTISDTWDRVKVFDDMPRLSEHLFGHLSPFELPVSGPSILFCPLFHHWDWDWDCGSIIRLGDGHQLFAILCLNKKSQPYALPHEHYAESLYTMLYMEMGLRGLTSKRQMKIMLRWMRERQKLRQICSHNGPHKQFLYTTWFTNPKNMPPPRPTAAAAAAAAAATTTRKVDPKP